MTHAHHSPYTFKLLRKKQMTVERNLYERFVEEEKKEIRLLRHIKNENVMYENVVYKNVVYEDAIFDNAMYV